MNGFESRFYEFLQSRGYADEEARYATLAEYVTAFASGQTVLDVGCGRGEFLELLRDHGCLGVGVDTDLGMVTVCREKGLNVEHADAFDFLRERQAAYDGIFASNFLEHLPPDQVQTFLQLAYRALKDGGILLVAVPNPESIVVHLHEFWRDATHARPYNRQLLEFLFVDTGFEQVTWGENPAARWDPAGLEGLAALEPINGALLEPRGWMGRVRRWLADFLVRHVLFEEFELMRRAFYQININLQQTQTGFQRALETIQANTRFLYPSREIYVKGCKPATDLPQSRESRGSSGQAKQASHSPEPRSRTFPHHPHLPAEGPGALGTPWLVGETKRWMKVAMLTPYLPYPPDTGGKIRSYYLLRSVAREHEVDLFTVYYHQPPEGIDAIESMGVRVHLLRLSRSWTRRKWLRGVLSPWPIHVAYFYGTEAAVQIRAQLAAGRYDLIHVDELCMAPYVQGLNAVPKLLMRDKVDFLHYRQVAAARPVGWAKLWDWLETAKLQRFERQVAEDGYAWYIVCSPEDQATLQPFNPHVSMAVIPNGVDSTYFHPLPLAPDRPTLVFTGTMHYYPNVDAVLYFAQHIWPQIVARVPDVQLYIVGHQPPPEIRALAAQGNVIVTGSVPDVRPYVARSTAMVVPLRLGSGTRLKILEAMAMERPVISTSVGCEGLALEPGRHLLVTDQPEAFAQQTAALLTDTHLQKCLVAEARKLVMARYTWDILGESLLEVYRGLVADRGE